MNLKIEIFNFLTMQFIGVYGVTKDSLNLTNDYMYNQKVKVTTDYDLSPLIGELAIIMTEDSHVIYTGVIKGVSGNSITLTPFIDKLDIVLFRKKYEGIIETLFKNGLTNYYKTNPDSKQNLPYLEIVTNSSTQGIIETTKSSIKLSELIVLAFKKYHIVVEVTADVSARKIIINLTKRGITHFEFKTDLPGIIIKNLTTGQTLPNKLEYVDKASLNSVGIYYLLTDGTVIDNTAGNSDNPDRILPVVLSRKIIDSANNNMDEMAKQDLGSYQFNQEFEISINMDDNFIDKSFFKVGNLVTIYTAISIYDSIISGITYDFKNNIIKLKCGMIREGYNYKQKMGEQL